MSDNRPMGIPDEIALLRARIEEVKTIHADGGRSRDESGIGFIDHACTTCGTFGEYGVLWPCETYLAVTK